MGRKNTCTITCTTLSLYWPLWSSTDNRTYFQLKYSPDFSHECQESAKVDENFQRCSRGGGGKRSWLWFRLGETETFFFSFFSAGTLCRATGEVESSLVYKVPAPWQYLSYITYIVTYHTYMYIHREDVLVHINQLIFGHSSSKCAFSKNKIK